MGDILTIRETVQRARDEGIMVSEYAVREWVRTGLLPVRKAGRKNLIYWPNFLRFMRCTDDKDHEMPQAATTGIRRVG